jgi:hypothetical protein
MYAKPEMDFTTEIVTQLNKANALPPCAGQARSEPTAKAKP